MEFVQSIHSIPTVIRTDTNEWHIWFTAFDDNMDEQEVFIHLNRDQMLRLMRDIPNAISAAIEIDLQEVPD